jgi:predicted DNA-binding transcriptional regulator AlpA
MREQPDFIPVRQLSERTGTPIKTLYNAHSQQKGPLHEILTKLGGRLGCWTADYDEWLDRQRKLHEAA